MKTLLLFYLNLGNYPSPFHLFVEIWPDLQQDFKGGLLKSQNQMNQNVLHQGYLQYNTSYTVNTVPDLILYREGVDLNRVELLRAEISRGLLTPLRKLFLNDECY